MSLPWTPMILPRHFSGLHPLPRDDNQRDELLRWKTLCRQLHLWLLLVVMLLIPTCASAIDLSETIDVAAEHTKPIRLAAGQTVQVSVRLQDPSQMPANARLQVRWNLVTADNPARKPRKPTDGIVPAREANAFEIYSLPTANWSKWLHALDADIYMIYRAPAHGVYALTLSPAEENVDLFQQPVWREPGEVVQHHAPPVSVPWPAGTSVPVEISLQTIDVSSPGQTRMCIEAEPNDTPEQAQPIPLEKTSKPYTLNVIGTSDDAEYFNNGYVGRSGDDWFRIEFPDSLEPRLLTACLSIPDQQVVARIRTYRVEAEHVNGYATTRPGTWLPIVEYDTGKNLNERAHQQPKNESHRTAINRTLEPGNVYLLRVESNAPAYDLELRIVVPAPYKDPHQAIRHGLYDHLGQVDAWLTNRPRGAAVERRIRDSGNLLGTNCMSCHTQSGVWGPSVPFSMGYRPQNIQAWRHLVNVCYQSMRPTNELKDAANNTSLKPLDIGDGPAGTRVAGHAVVALERFAAPRKLQSLQSIRAANYVCQTTDPGGINAAGPGANVGKGVVFNYSGEVVAAAWQKTGDLKYFQQLEDKARKMLTISPKYTDDLAHRIEFFCRYFPPTLPAASQPQTVPRHTRPSATPYVEQATQVADKQGLDETHRSEAITQARALAASIQKQIGEDLERLRTIQLADGGWNFDPGSWDEESGSWKINTAKPDHRQPSPTALALIAMEAMGLGSEDEHVSRGIQSLLQMQHPTGFWNGASKTGFVSTSYALHALARYFPVPAPTYTLAQFQAPENESLLARIRRVRQLSMTEDVQLMPLLLNAANDTSPLVRYWALLGLGSLRHADAVKPLVQGLGDNTKVVREAAHWGLRQQLTDDTGWEQVLEAATTGDDYTREAALRALVMKVDAVLPNSQLNLDRLATVLDHALNEDPHPAVRAWATRAAWQWWVWNPPIRPALNLSWHRLLTRDEPEALVENAIRYQTQALFIVNGHAANASNKHQYLELKSLFETILTTFREHQGQDTQQPSPLVQRLVGVAATYYQQRGADGGPGQLGYSTPGGGTLFGEAILSEFAQIETLPESGQRALRTKLTLEAAANIPYETLQEKLVDYSLNGPEHLRSVAASSISDPRLVRLPAVAEQLEPMHAQLLRGADEPPRRKDLSDPILKMYGGVSWDLPQSNEARIGIIQYLVPDFLNWRSSAQIDAITQATEKQDALRATDAAWYLAQGVGQAIQKNPDLHFDQMAAAFPNEFVNHAVARFWLYSIPWILTYERELPQVNVDPKAIPPVDPYEALRTRALRLLLTQLDKTALSENRKLAVELANQTAIRRNPEVLNALATLESFETDDQVLENAKKILSQEQGQFTTQLATEIAKLAEHSFETTAEGTLQLPDDFLQDVIYFRDYVVPEMSRVLRADERSCMICHGEPGRVPSMELHAPDRVGYLPVDQLLANYRQLQQRVNLGDVEKSKFLRKPLNIQTGEEDGHQGGRRYQPNDPGYLILRKWVMNQVQLQQKHAL